MNWDWTVEMNALATAQMLLSGGRPFKHAEDDRELSRLDIGPAGSRVPHSPACRRSSAASKFRSIPELGCSAGAFVRTLHPASSPVGGQQLSRDSADWLFRPDRDGVILESGNYG
jgi:hypothetical protein